MAQIIKVRPEDVKIIVHGVEIAGTYTVGGSFSLTVDTIDVVWTHGEVMAASRTVDPVIPTGTVVGHVVIKGPDED